MSQFSGKSDYADTVLMHYSVDEALKAETYVDGVRVYPKDEKDIIPLYPRLISSMAGEKLDDGTSRLTINISAKSYVDEADIEKSSWIIRGVLETSKKLKRKPTAQEVNDYTQSVYKEEAALPAILDKLPDWVYSIRLGKTWEQRDLICKALAERYWEPTLLSTYYRKVLIEYAEKRGCKITGELFHQKWLIDRYEENVKKYGVK